MVSGFGLIVNGRLYEISKISSLTYKKLSPNYSYSVFCLLLGLALIIDEGKLFAFGGCFVFTGILTLFLAKPRHVVVLTLPEGHKDVVMSTDKAHIDRVIQALEASMSDFNTTDSVLKSLAA